MEEPNSVLEGQIQNSHLEDHIIGIEHQTIEHEEITNEYNSTTEVHNGPVKSDNENSTEIGNTANLSDSQSQDQMDEIEVLHESQPKPILVDNLAEYQPDSNLTENTAKNPEVETPKQTKPPLAENPTEDQLDSKLTESLGQKPEAPKKQKNSYTRADMIDDLTLLKTKVEQLSNQLAVFQARKMN